jgi:ribosomal protein L20A (L18A)|tara:strand:- start:819 stop:1088 length:270 start_codon:yes stop_codon:yes gene_type:complete
MQAFRVSGTAPFGSQRQKFDLDIVASSTDDAEHRCYSIIGSRHKANRRSITITSVSEIDPRTSTEARVLDAFREQIAAAGGTIAQAEEK